MKIGIITDSLQDMPFTEALDWVAAQGIQAVEIGTGNFSHGKHCDLEKLGERGWRARRILGRYREPWVDTERAELQRQSTRSTPGNAARGPRMSSTRRWKPPASSGLTPWSR